MSNYRMPRQQLTINDAISMKKAFRQLLYVYMKRFFSFRL